jgi:hypothetical protein
MLYYTCYGYEYLIASLNVGRFQHPAFFFYFLVKACNLLLGI